MTKTILLAGAALALLAPAVYAQSAGGPPPAPGMDAGRMPPPGRGHGFDGPDRHGPPPPSPRAAHFRMERGDLALDVKCADDEPVKACSDFTLTLLDKLAALPAPPPPPQGMPGTPTKP